MSKPHPNAIFCPGCEASFMSVHDLCEHIHHDCRATGTPPLERHKILYKVCCCGDWHASPGHWSRHLQDLREHYKHPATPKGWNDTIRTHWIKSMLAIEEEVIV